MSTRRLEIGTEEKKTETTTQLAELGRKTHAINQLVIELGQNDATLLALEARDKNLREQLRVTKEELALKSSALREAERALPDAEAEFAKLAAELGERSIMVDSHHEELAKLRKQVETLNLGIANYERTRGRPKNAYARTSQRGGRGEGVRRGVAQAQWPRGALRRAGAAAPGADNRSRAITESCAGPGDAARGPGSPSCLARIRNR